MKEGAYRVWWAILRQDADYKKVCDLCREKGHEAWKDPPPHLNRLVRTYKEHGDIFNMTYEQWRSDRKEHPPSPHDIEQYMAARTDIIIKTFERNHGREPTFAEFKELDSIRHDVALNFKSLREDERQKYSEISKEIIPLEEKPVAPQCEDPAGFVEALTVRYENDESISFQAPGRPPMVFDLTSLGFRGGKQKATWNKFIEVLQKPPHHWETESKDASRKQLQTVCKRLAERIKNEFNITLPQEYRLYERVKSAGPGIYRFKFKVQYGDTIKTTGLPDNKEAFRKRFYHMLKEQGRENETVMEMASEGLNKNFLTKEELQKHFPR